MIPLVQLAAVPITSTIGDVVDLICKTGYSRIPVYKDRIFNLTGVVRAFDILEVTDRDAPVRQFVREVPYVPEMKKLEDLLLFLQKKRKSLAIVVDEYGGATGIITIEDILEEVVGEIRDEYDHVVTDVVKLEKNRFRINARVEIDHLNEQLGLNLPKDNYETLGGFILKYMGRIPRPGETLAFENLTFKISQANKRSVVEVIVIINEN
jgi:CBS domain containing-hemolysin-like protein